MVFLISQEGNKIEVQDNHILLTNPIITQFDKNNNLPITFEHLELIVHQNIISIRNEKFLLEHIKFLKMFVLKDHIKKFILNYYQFFKSNSNDIHENLSIYDMHLIPEEDIDDYLNQRINYASEDEILKINKIKNMIEMIKIKGFKEGKKHYIPYNVSIENEIITIPYVINFVDKNYYNGFASLSEDNKNNFDFIKSICSLNGYYLNFASNELKNNFELIKIACFTNGRYLKYVHDKFKNNFEIVKIACSQDGKALKYVYNEFGNNFEIVKIACSQYSEALKYASFELINNFEIVKIACSKQGTVLRYASNGLKNNFEIVKIACSQYGYALKYASDELKNNFEIVKIACSQCGYALEFASTRLKNNFEIVKIACSQNGMALLYTSDELKNDFEIVKIAYYYNKNALNFASDELRNNFKMRYGHKINY